MKAFAIAALSAALALQAAAAPIPGVDLAPFGAQTGWPHDPGIVNILNRMNHAGIRWGRSDLCWWGNVEQTPGVYVFDDPAYNVDRMIALMRERGIEPFVILCYSNPLYDGDVGPFSDTGRAAFAEYCHAAAARYRDQVSHWEIWNEPNLEEFWHRTPDPVDYTRLVHAAAPRIREANPDAVIAGGSTSLVDLDFLGTCFDQGLLNDVDVVTVHPYRNPQMPETVNGELAQLRAMIEASRPASREIAVWSGEWGYNTAWPGISELTQAKYLSRMIVNNLSQGVQNSIWFSTHPYEGWGLLGASYEPRPSFDAMRVLNEHLAAPVEHIDDPFSVTASPRPSGWRAEVFRHGPAGHHTVALWLARTASDSFTGRTATVSLALSPEVTIRAYDGLTGTPVGLTVSSGEAEISLTGFRVPDYPVFLEIDSPLSYEEPLPGGENLALDAVADATDSDYGPEWGGANAHDGVVSLESKWASASVPGAHWLALDLGASAEVTGTIVVGAGAANEPLYLKTESFEIQSGPSLGGPWSTLRAEQNAFQRDRVVTIFDPPLAARFVRLHVNDAGIDNVCRIPEFEVYGVRDARGISHGLLLR
jgi:hypothetical protein